MDPKPLAQPNAQSADTPAKPAPYRRVDQARATAMFADSIALGNCAAVARKYGVHVSTVARIVQRFKRLAPEAIISQSDEHRLAELQGHAIEAVDAGLTARRDPYKRAAIGVQVMSRTHPAWQGGNQVVALQAVFGHVPADWRAEYAIPGDSTPALPTPGE